MFSSTLAENTIIMRPGLISGLYPERGDVEHGWIDRSFNVLKGLPVQLGIDHWAGLRRVAKAINRQGDALMVLDSTELGNLILNLRHRLRSQGLASLHCIQAFALIRELSARTLHLRHYDSQLMAGWAMLQGQLAEMETGEGKTLAATLAAATVALAGIPVHVITVNEYLVERDAQAMEPLYQALGLTVGYVTENMDTEQRRVGYRCDITYCTNKQVAFDYLRDRLLLGNNRNQLRLRLESAYAENNRLHQFLLRGLCFAIVDEADSVLIDEARTPLILTRNVDSKVEHTAYRQALSLAKQLQCGIDFFIDPAQCVVLLSMAGQQKLADLHQAGKGFWQNPRQREELVLQGLKALHLLHKDRDYLVHEDRVLIVDANTGRTMPDRSWERGLHQLVEAKEGCPLTDAREHLGRLTYQRFFRRYVRLGGMTGTAREVRSELWSVYGLRVQRIPLHLPSRRWELPTKVYPLAKEKWVEVITSVKEMQNQGRPVLIGTGSVAESELLNRKLTEAGIIHRVLNARQDKKEAEIIAAAGKKRQVTVTTNMAGRGTDIPLADGIAELGGLHVIATCYNDAKRIDRQLYGRCARQGDPGSYQRILSLEDELSQRNSHPIFLKLLRFRMSKNNMFQRKCCMCIIRHNQRGIERRHREARRVLLQYDRQIGRLLAFSGNFE